MGALMQTNARFALGLGLSLTLLACKAQMGGPGDDGTGPNGPGGTPGTNGPKEVLELPGGLKIDGAPKYFRVVRLTHAQWENSVRDVLLLPAPTGQSSTFLPDPPDGKFSNNERALYVNDTLSGDYLRSAEAVAGNVAGDAAQLGRLSAPGDSAGFIASVGRRAFRRALSPEEQSSFEALWAQGATFYASGDAFADGARVFLEALLQSPNFLYRVELTPPGTRLSGTELATKISFLLRNTTPDDALLDAAESGQFDSDEGVRTFATSFLDQDGARLALENFHRELFGLDRYSSIEKSPTAYPTFTEDLIPMLVDADLQFFSHIYTQGLGFRDILTSDVAFVNDRTAPFYGISASSPDLQLTTLDGSRPGYLTRLGFLAYNANLSAPDPIHRGVDINNKLLCTKLSPPPGEIPALPDPIPGQTNRERVEAHTGEGFCGNCHNEIINPPGFALESFDAVGQFRTTDNNKPVDTTGSLLAGEGMITFANINELTSQLAQNPVAHSCYAAHLAEYAFARDLGSDESDLVSAAQAQSLDASASIKSIMLAILTSPAFTSATKAVQ